MIPIEYTIVAHTIIFDREAKQISITTAGKVEKLIKGDGYSVRGRNFTLPGFVFRRARGLLFL